MPNPLEHTSNPLEHLMTSADVCEQLGIDRSTLSRRVSMHKLTPVVRLPGTTGAMLFDRDEIMALEPASKKAKAA